MNFFVKNLFLLNFFNLKIKKYNNNYFSNINIKKSFFPFIQTSNLKNVFLSNSKFENFLNRVLYITNNIYENYYFELKQNHFALENITIYNCGFNLCKSTNDEGGAIFSLSNLNIIKCYFYNNYANIGGSIYCKSTLNIQFSTFKDGYSEKGGGIYQIGLISSQHN